MLKELGIESPLKFTITLCVVSLIVITTLGGSGTAPPVFFIYRTLLILIAILCTIGSYRAELRIAPAFIALLAAFLMLMLVSVLRIRGSHFEGFYLLYQYALFALAFSSLGNYARYQSAGWKALLLGAVVTVCIIHLIPDIVVNRSRVFGFSPSNPDYFATFLLIGVAASLAAAIFGKQQWRIVGAATAGLLLFGILRTASRGATLASVAILIVAAIRSGKRIPRQLWLLVALSGSLAAVVFSPSLISKFLDLNESNPYNYARLQIWKSSLDVIAQEPLLGVGFGQFVHASKRFTFPMEGQVARYLVRAGIAHSEYLQHMAELGIPAAIVLFSLLGYLVYLTWKRSKTASVENRWFHEAAVLTALGVGGHALVDNCWTIPVTASSLIVLSVADPLPLDRRKTALRWRALRPALVTVLLTIIYVHSVVIPGFALHYNQRGHQASARDDFQNAERFHRSAIQIVPDYPVFLDDLGLVYMQQFAKTSEPGMLESARVYFARAIAAGPQSLETHLHMENALVQSLSGSMELDSEVHKAIVENDAQLLLIDPYLPFQRRNLASAYYNLGQRDRAFEELRRAIDYEPNYVPGYLMMSSWYLDRGDSLESQRYAANALSIVNKYRNFKPTDVYEAILLGRPDSSWTNARIVKDVR